MKYSIAMFSDKKVSVYRECDTLEQVYENLKDAMCVILRAYVIDNDDNSVVYSYKVGDTPYLKNKGQFSRSLIQREPTDAEVEKMQYAKNRTIAHCFARMKNVRDSFIVDLFN